MNGDDDLNAVLVQEVADDVQRAIADFVTDLPSAQQQKILEQTGRHLLCSLLALAVQALEPLAEADQQIAEALTRPDSPHRLGLSEQVFSKLFQVLITKIVEAAGHTALAKAKATLKLLRICAIASCPDPARHEEISLHCIAPLAGEATNAAAVAYFTRFERVPPVS